MIKLSKEQAKLLAEFFANLGVAWLAAGIVAPLITGKIVSEMIKSGLIAVSWTGFLLIFSLYLFKEFK